jgi:endonuclease G
MSAQVQPFSRLVLVAVAVAAGALSGCGGEASIEDATEAAFVAQQELTKPLELAVPRRTYGVAGQLRSYTLPLNLYGALKVELSGSRGDAQLTVADPEGKRRCTTTNIGMQHACTVETAPAGTWVIEVIGGSDFSGSLLASAPDAADAGRSDAGEPNEGPPDAGHGARTLGASVSVHTTMGLPGSAGVDERSLWLLVKPQYVVSYNSTTKTPNWVSWELSSSWFGSASRSSSFRPDPDLPNTVPQPANGDFDGTDYSRGHLCPSSDRTTSATDNDATFVFTNVVPQVPNLNNGPWKGLENEERQLARAGKTLFITAGPIRGTGQLRGGINIPSATWKVIVVFDGPASAASVTAATRVIAVIMRNSTSTSGTWETFRTSVRDIEAQTGLDLLSDVASWVQDEVETRVDAAPPLGG